MINQFVNSGFTIIFIAHQQEEKDGSLYPAGDKKRCLSPIINNCDVVAWIQPNGVDENGKEIKSSAWFVQTNVAFARSRYPYMTEMIPEFTIQNLAKAIDDAIADQEKAEGITSVSYEEQKQNNEVKEMTYDEVMDAIQDAAERYNNAGQMEVLQGIVEENLGAGKRVMDCKPSQVQALSVILDELLNKAEELGIQ